MWVSNIPTPPVGNTLKRKLKLVTEDTFKGLVDFTLHGTTQSALVKYFKHMISTVGCGSNMGVSLRAWELLCTALAVANANSESEEMGSESHPPNSVKAIVCACVSLAVEVSADFESEFVVSCAAWGHLLYSEVAGRGLMYPTRSEIESLEKTARDLMKLKLIISSGLCWHLGFKTCADYLAQYTSDLTQYAGCDICESLKENSDKISSHQISIIQALSWALFSKGESPEVIALMALMVSHETFISRQASSKFPVNRMRRALRITKNSIESNGLQECILEMAGRTLDSAQPLLRARDLLLCNETAASVLEFADAPYSRRSSFLREIDSCLQNDDTFNNLL
jgi:hypothetical protein